MSPSSAAIIIATTFFLGSIHAQVTCPNSGGQGVYDGICVSCPPLTWAAGGISMECGACLNNVACNPYDGSSTLCGYGIKNCDASTGNAQTCLANFFLDGSNGCSACDSGSTTPDGNQLTVCNGQCDSPDTPMIGCSPGTDGCNTNTGVSINCYQGNELIGKACSPCTTNMQQPINASTNKCMPCMIGQDSCVATGQAITCSANYYITPANVCLLCPVGQVSGPGNQLGACSAPPTCIGKSCPASTFVSGNSCNPCAAGSSSKGGLNSKCQSCGAGAKTCSISSKGGIVVGSCYSAYGLSGGKCQKLSCPANTFAINSKCHGCNGSTFNPPNNRLPVCQVCRKGESTCTYLAATTCQPKFYLLKGRCVTRNVYDYFYGYHVCSTLTALKTIPNLTPAQCLIACEGLKGCKSFHASTNGLIQAGLCLLYGKVLQMTDITTITVITSIAPRTLSLSASQAASVKMITARTVKPVVKAIVKPVIKSVAKPAVNKKVIAPVSYSIHIVMNRRPGQGSFPSISGIPLLTKTCTTLAGTCFI